LTSLPAGMTGASPDQEEEKAGRLEERGLRLEQTLNLPEVVMAGDEDRLKQLFANLLENALRYVDVPRVLRVWEQHTAEELTLHFVDSGPGVPEASLERLFDRLYRVDEARTREQGGSGLGLAIGKSIVAALGGRIKAANAPGAGLWIEIRLPLLLIRRQRKAAMNAPSTLTSRTCARRSPPSSPTASW